MDLTTQYLGMSLRSPLVPSASPLTSNLDNLKRMEDAGAGAVVLPSLFQEQLTRDSLELHQALNQGSESHAEAQAYFPPTDSFQLGAEAYLEHLRRAKEALAIPVIASLNGNTKGGWTSYAGAMADAGADAIELNIYDVITDASRTALEIEQEYLSVVEAVRDIVEIPVSVKLSPYFTNLPNMALRLASTGANGLVLFNRFYQPEVDIEHLEIMPQVLASRPQDMRLPLTWIGILYGRVPLDLAATTGIYGAHHVVQLLMVGARATMLCAVLYQRGIDVIRNLEHDVKHWMEDHQYSSVQQMQGSMSQQDCPNPDAFQRAQYVQAVGAFKAGPYATSVH